MPVSRTKPDARPRGFALVVVLTLLVLLTIIALGLLSLSSIALRTSSRAADLSTARANARMALMLAIGKLQVELGPDQRINANAALTQTGADPSRASWLGVWESWPGGQKSRPTPAFRSWLVSGDPAMQADPNAPGAPAGTFVNLGNPESATAISVPLQPLERGAYAYWISDENSKARLGPAFKTDDEDLAAHLGRWQSPAGHGLRRIRAAPGDRP